MHPGGELGSPVKAVDSSHQDDKCLLGGIKSIGIVAGQSTAEGVDLVVVAAEEGIECCLVAPLGVPDQFRVISRGLDTPRLPTLHQLLVARGFDYMKFEHAIDTKVVLQRLLVRPVDPRQWEML